ncbi:MAG: transglycosylase domain-containing protein [Schleiferiaceae bacterium]|nr:transglycosylase domain-containing protein [Schleiferiaceae bacterium]MDP4767959.1 transglycosylase domain-containing protein [Schleiferiaceae bacterium]MDP4958851.1 transglycosylase domain-containing protein [Schleiferiaceae bacterium]
MAQEIEKKKRNYRKQIIWTVVVLTGPVWGLTVLLSLTSMGVFGELPNIAQIANPDTKLATEIITEDGETLGTFFRENRTAATFDELSPWLGKALVATEDERFYSHSGVDAKALARAVAYVGTKGGGSTLTQQLAKMQYNEPARNLVERIGQKLGEWIIAVQLERLYTKDEIIALYLNQLDFLYQAVGINSAARVYFNKKPIDLTIEEAAVFVAMAKNPSLYNPKRYPERTKQRRDQVFVQMVKNGMLTVAEKDSLQQIPLQLEFRPQSHTAGLAPYFREYLRGYMKEWIKDYEKRTGRELDLYSGGLKIYTTINAEMQQNAEEAVQEHLSNYQRIFDIIKEDRKYGPFYFDEDPAGNVKRIVDRAMKNTQRYRGMKRRGASQDSIQKAFATPIPMTVFTWNGDKDTVLSPRDSIMYYKGLYQVGMMSVEPQTGHVKAWVGGNDYQYFKYDHVKQGKRQVGSTFKPFVYASAILEKNYSPCMEVPNAKICIEKGEFGLIEDWCPSNSDDKYGGTKSLKHALANSMNTVTTFLMKQVGPRPVIDLARRMGITGDIPEVPSIALGTVDLSVYEMVGSYTTFANKGRYVQPIMVTRIEDKNGVVLEEFTPETRQVMSDRDAYVILKLLMGVTEDGTGVRLRHDLGKNFYRNNAVTGYPYKFTNEIAGKTGTTQNNSDGWFMGAVPNLITGVWTGCEDRAAHMGGGFGTYYGQGATAALPIWAVYMKKNYANPDLGISKSPFERPKGALGIDVDCVPTTFDFDSGEGDDFDENF